MFVNLFFFSAQYYSASLSYLFAQLFVLLYKTGKKAWIFRTLLLLSTNKSTKLYLFSTKFIFKLHNIFKLNKKEKYFFCFLFQRANLGWIFFLNILFISFFFCQVLFISLNCWSFSTRVVKWHKKINEWKMTKKQKKTRSWIYLGKSKYACENS